MRVASIATTVDPLQLVRAAAGLFAEAQYFRDPGGDDVAGLGIAHRVTASGASRFARLGAVAAAEPLLPAGSRLLLGFSFLPEGPRGAEWAGFGAADLILPRVTVVRNRRGGRVTIAIPPGGDPDPLIELLASLDVPEPPALPDPGIHTVESIPSTLRWRTAVREAIGAIAAGSLEKVVLARSVKVVAEREPRPFDLVHHLASPDSGSYVFGFQAGDATLVGASPELLLATDGESIRVNPLAGSARRGEGDDDEVVAKGLMASDKDRREHAIVVADIAGRLGPLTGRLDVPARPGLLKLATVQHLSTEISGRLRGGVDAFDVLGTLHPTPAVGGTPRPAALAFIDKEEEIDRGWYTGGVGWVDLGGSARVALALRCALISGTTARLYAGNGIVFDSDPEAELVETRLKFRPLLNLLAVT